MENNILLITWLQDKKTDLAPYYLNKLDFLKTYGTRCRTQYKPEDGCEQYKDEDNCIGGKELYCEYTNDQCVDVIDSICNYYDSSGNYIEEKWGEEQVKYIDDLYNLAGSLEYGKTLDNNTYNTYFKSNAFHIIYDKFKLTINDTKIYNKRACYATIENQLKNNRSFMDQIHKKREELYKKMYNYEYNKMEHDYVKVPELTYYVYEVLKKNKINTLSFNDIFSHNSSIDEKIKETLEREGVCIAQIHNKKTGSKPIKIDLLNDISKEDFITDNNKSSVMIFELLQYTWGIIKSVPYYVGKLIINIIDFCLKNRNYIAFMLSMVLLIFVGMHFLMDTTVINSNLASFLDTFGIGQNIIFFIRIGEYLKENKAVINIAFKCIRNITCFLLPYLSNPKIIHASIGHVIGNYIADGTYRRQFEGVKALIPFKLFNELQYLTISQVALMFIKTELLHCDKHLELIGTNKDISWKDTFPTETDISWAVRILKEDDNNFVNMTHFFTEELFHSPFESIKILFEIIGSFLNNSAWKSFEEGNVSSDKSVNIATDILKYLHTVLWTGRGGLATESSSLSDQVTGALKNNLTLNIDITKSMDAFKELLTFKLMFFSMISIGVIFGYMSNTYRKIYKEGLNKGIQKAEKVRNNKKEDKSDKKGGNKTKRKEKNKNKHSYKNNKKTKKKKKKNKKTKNKKTKNKK